MCQVQGTLRLQLSVSLAPPHEAGLQLSLHLLAVFSLHLASLALARLDLATLLSTLHTSGCSKILKLKPAIGYGYGAQASQFHI